MVDEDRAFSYGSFPLFLFLFFMNAGEYIAGGPTSLIKGAAFSSQLCVFMAEPLLLKYNHSNLLLWFPIERISFPSFPERNLWLFAARVWCLPSLPFPWCLQTAADTGFSGLYIEGFFWSEVAAFK